MAGELTLINDSNTDESIELHSSNGYAVQSTTFESLPPRKVTTEKCPGDSDPFEFDAGFDAKVVNINVIVIATSRDDMKTKLHNLKKLLLNDWIRIYQNPPGRYLRVKPTNIEIPETTEAKSLKVTLSMDFLAPMPWQLANDFVSIVESDITSSPKSILHSNDGDRFVYPIFTIINSDTGDLIDITITHIGDNKVLTFGAIIPASSILIIDNATRTITLDGEDAIQYVEGNTWIKLNSGNNSLTIETSTGESYSYDFVIEYRPRYC